jgi:hypothetical protein
MYVIAIAWLYVTVLMAATEPNLTAGILTFSLYGLFPIALLLWLLGTPERGAGVVPAKRRRCGDADAAPTRFLSAYSSQIRLAMRPVTPSRR